MLRNAPKAILVLDVFRSASVKTMPRVTLNPVPVTVPLGGMGLIARGRVLMDIGEPVAVKFATAPKMAQSVTRKTASASVAQAI